MLITINPPFIMFNRYTIHDTDYRLAIKRTKEGPARPPVMSSWPPVLRGRRSRDRPWYV